MKYINAKELLPQDSSVKSSGTPNVHIPVQREKSSWGRSKRNPAAEEVPDAIEDVVSDADNSYYWLKASVVKEYNPKEDWSGRLTYTLVTEKRSDELMIQSNGEARIVNRFQLCFI